MPENIQLKTDPDILRKILSHLVCNAVKYTEKGTIDLGFRIKNNIPEFFVTDTGIGFESKKVNSIFEYNTHSDLTSSRGLRNKWTWIIYCKRPGGITGRRNIY